MDAVGRPRSVLLVGGSSAIGRAIVRELTGGKGRLVLAGRDRDRTMRDADGLGGTLQFVPFVAEETSTHEGCVAEAWADGDIDLVVVAHGVLPDNESSWNDPTRAYDVVMVNMASAVAVLAAVAARMQDQGHGTIVVLSSMAGQRARRSNFLYGASKAGLDSFATGLGDALRPHGCRVIVVRPGFVHSPMTAGLTPAPFATNPEDVGTAVAAAVRAGHDEVWAPSILRWVATVLRHLPRSVTRRIRS